MQKMKNNNLGVVQCVGDFLKQHPIMIAFFCLLQAVGVFGQTPDRLPDPNFHLYLLIGQSNMAGRGKTDEESQNTKPRVLMFTKELAWKPASDPLHFDKPFAGVGPGLAFGKQMAATNPRIRIGLIPCAVGGTSIQAWAPGAEDQATHTHPYDDMLKRVREAQKAGVLKGILWHQGEADRSASATYDQSLASLIARLRREFDAPNLPFVAGELGTFNPDNQADTEKFNAVLRDLTNSVKGYACVSSRGLKDRGDHLHFNAASARILGQRYAEAMLALQRR